MDSKTRIRWVLIGVLALGILLYLLRVVLAPVFLALVIAYILDPVIDRLEECKIPRTPAIFLFLFAVLTFVAALFLILIPAVGKEIATVVKAFPEYYQRIQVNVFPWLEKALGKELPTTLDDALKVITANMERIPPDVIKPFATIIQRVFSSTLLILMGLLNVVIVPVFAFYFLKDFDRMKEAVAELIPMPYKDWAIGKFTQVDDVLGSFMRGQLTLCTILAILYTSGLLLTGIDMAVAIGVLSGYLFIVPYLGTIFGVVAASIMALLKFHDYQHVLAVLAVFAVVQLIEGYLLTPKIVGDKVGLSPVMVILSLLIGAGLFGFLGILLAVPVAAILNIFADDLITYYRSSDLFLGVGHADETGGEE